RSVGSMATPRKTSALTPCSSSSARTRSGSPSAASPGSVTIRTLRRPRRRASKPISSVAPRPNLIGDISMTKTVSVGSVTPFMALPPARYPAAVGRRRIIAPRPRAAGGGPDGHPIGGARGAARNGAAWPAAARGAGEAGGDSRRGHGGAGRSLGAPASRARPDRAGGPGPGGRTGPHAARAVRRRALRRGGRHADPAHPRPHGQLLRALRAPADALHDGQPAGVRPRRRPAVASRRGADEPGLPPVRPERR